jgi:hypothetical protein
MSNRPAPDMACRRATNRRCAGERAAALVAIGVSLGGCAARIPLPAETSHEGDTPVVVPYPPPPAQVEMVGPPPDDAAVWVDGSWRWTGTAWTWTEGEWERPPSGARYAPPIVVRQSNGELVYFPGSWHAPSAPATSSAAPSAR